MASLGNDEGVLLRKGGVFFIAVALHHRPLIFLVPYVRDALEVQKWRDVVLETVLPDRAAQNVARAEKVVKQTRAGEYVFFCLCARFHHYPAT